ncbi:hypothetical protein PCH_Pc18g00750 [Penicillium rubens Wisconsin 54-1255]|uniref:Uncharacterized protein n=1 Tax=Penicillium rubens (strain ATCC 28089 / DSM 1075 / NRRL 1951 / Wisconsin 54-1255) TaxID=500485 RepID=B6HBZ1_PENRW|nr:hypothetical protein PCH_Pc18g00750 [Penicillium rubens Wisconsin 54-1255]
MLHVKCLGPKLGGNLDIWAVPTGGSEDIVEKDSERNNPRLLGQTTEARIEGIRVFRVFCWVAGVSRKGPAYIECIEIRGKAWNKSRLLLSTGNERNASDPVTVKNGLKEEKNDHDDTMKIVSKTKGKGMRQRSGPTGPICRIQAGLSTFSTARIMWNPLSILISGTFLNFLERGGVLALGPRSVQGISPTLTEDGPGTCDRSSPSCRKVAGIPMKGYDWPVLFDSETASEQAEFDKDQQPPHKPT